jgi:carbonic anhydrase/acetyltransferase-like protein (isoleucine patch superfamily)
VNTYPYRSLSPRIAEDVYIAPGARVIGDVVIGESSSVWFNAVIRGDVHYIKIGSYTNVQDNCILHVTGPRLPGAPVVVGDRVTVGHGVTLHGCTIEDDCLIGMGTIILDGCRVGKGSFIGAGSLLLPGFQVPPGSVVMGSPARVKRKVSDVERELIEYGWVSYILMATDCMKTEKAKPAKLESLPLRAKQL